MMRTLQHEDLTVRVVEGSTTVVAFSGTSDMRDPMPVLSPYLSQVKGLLDGRNCQIDLTALAYMNSSSVSPLMQFVRELDSAGVPTVMIFCSDFSWQRTSYRAFKIIALRLHHLKVEIR
jgi:hypothetical protein